MSVHSRKPMGPSPPPEFVPGINWARTIAEALGMPHADRVLALTLDCPAEGLLTVTAEFAVDKGRLDRAVGELRKYAVSLAPLDPPADA